MAYSKKSYVEHVAVRVQDIHWHIRFFREVLGMTVRQTDGPDDNPAQYWSVGGMQLIADPGFEGPEGRLAHLGIMVEDLEQALREAQAFGVSEMPQGHNCSHRHFRVYPCARRPYTARMNETVHSVRPAPRTSKPAGKETTRTNDPARTMAGILDVATVEFAEKGLAGARIDEIAAATQTSKRMIYYYFGSKEGLYLAVLEESYRRMRTIEAALHLEDLEPEQALRTLVGFTFDHHHKNENYIRLVMSENMQRGQYLAQSKIIQELNVPAIQGIRDLYDRGIASGVFRPGLDPIDIHASISALTFFNVSNQHTFGLIFKRDTQTPAAIAARRESITDMVVRYVRAP